MGSTLGCWTSYTSEGTEVRTLRELRLMSNENRLQLLPGPGMSDDSLLYIVGFIFTWYPETVESRNVNRAQPWRGVITYRYCDEQSDVDCDTVSCCTRRCFP